MSGYLERLTLRLTEGIGLLPEEVRTRHAGYLKGAQRPDGGFAGREGPSDLYYTGFALRGLAITGELYGDIAEKAAEFLRGRLSGRESIVDFLSLIYGAMLVESASGLNVFAEAPPQWRSAVAETLEKLRRDDGGYAKTAEGMASSTYHTFLVLLCRELLEQPVPAPERIHAFLLSQQAEGGGFREIRASKRAGTNPTAAAIGALQMLGGIAPEIREATLDFLCEMQTDEGGLRANTRIPIADLLSTFTGLVTLIDLDATQEIDLTAARRFVASLECPQGGFHGAAWDPAHDVEYSFYGLGCLGLFATLP